MLTICSSACPFPKVLQEAGSSTAHCRYFDDALKNETARHFERETTLIILVNLVTEPCQKKRKTDRQSVRPAFDDTVVLMGKTKQKPNSHLFHSGPQKKD